MSQLPAAVVAQPRIVADAHIQKLEGRQGTLSQVTATGKTSTNEFEHFYLFHVNIKMMTLQYCPAVFYVKIKLHSEVFSLYSLLG